MKTEHTAKEGTRNQTELQIAETKDMSLSRTIAHLNGIENEAYRVTIRANSEWNEITVKLYSGSRKQHVIASSFIDRGHTAKTKREAANELRSIIQAYLRR